MGHVRFVTLRDYSGLVQLRVDTSSGAEAQELVQSLTLESVVQVKGKVGACVWRCARGGR